MNLFRKVITGKRIRIKAVKYYVIAGQLIKLKVVNYSRLRPIAKIFSKSTLSIGVAPYLPDI